MWNDYYYYPTNFHAHVLLIFPLPIHAAHKINGLDYRNSLDPVIVADQPGLALDTSFNGIHV